MSYSLQFQQNQKQMQHLMVTEKMQQAIHYLQLPIQELSLALHQELELNPLVEEIDEAPLARRVKRGKEPFLESMCAYKPSLFEHLMQQAQEVFSKEDLKLAETLIGNFDEKGFLTTKLEELFSTLEPARDVLKTIQTFEPKGIGASGLRECLLIQMEKTSLAYQIVDKHFDDLLQNRIPKIEKGLGVSASVILETVEKEISRLDLSPGANFSKDSVSYIQPDMTILQSGEELSLEMDADFLPPIRINRHYLDLLEDPEVSLQDKEFIKEKLSSVKWLVRSVDQRFRTLDRIGDFLIEKQRAFFLSSDGKLKPLVLREVAEALEVHESTVARAVSGKYLASPRGVFPLRFFFTQGLQSEGGDFVSSHTVKEALSALIKEEEKERPLSDEKLSELLKERGFTCARRTIAKYRKELSFGSARQRKKYL